MNKKMQLLQDILISRKKHKLALRNRARRFEENKRYKQGIKLGMNEEEAFNYAWNKKYLEKWNKKRLKAQTKANEQEQKEYNERMKRNALIKRTGKQAERKTHLLKLKGISIKKYPKAIKTHRRKHLIKVGNKATINNTLRRKALGKRWKGR